MFGVIAMLCFFVFVVSTMIWWVLVECDACQLEATGLGDDDSGCALMANPLTWGCCRLFSQLLLAICSWVGCSTWCRHVPLVVLSWILHL